MEPSTERRCARTHDERLRATFDAPGLRFHVSSPSEPIARAVSLVYGEMAPASGPAPRGRELEIEIVPSDGEPSVLEVRFDGTTAFSVSRLGDLLHQLDNQLTIAIETAAPEYYFVHAAALEEGGSVTILSGESGAGKSTTAYALTATGASYLSDELAPIEPATGLVTPYPRALCLKRPPPPPLGLPDDALRTEWTIHVAPRSLRAPVPKAPRPLGRLVFVSYRPTTTRPVLRPLPRGEAALRLYQQALNQLAHPCMGLDETLGIVRGAECFELLSAGIEETLELLRREG